MKKPYVLYFLLCFHLPICLTCTECSSHSEPLAGSWNYFLTPLYLCTQTPQPCTCFRSPSTWLTLIHFPQHDSRIASSGSLLWIALLHTCIPTPCTYTCLYHTQPQADLNALLVSPQSFLDIAVSWPWPVCVVLIDPNPGPSKQRARPQPLGHRAGPKSELLKVLPLKPGMRCLLWPTI